MSKMGKCFIIVVFALVGFAVGEYWGWNRHMQECVNQGVAEWKADRLGNVSFEFKGEKVVPR